MHKWKMGQKVYCPELKASGEIVIITESFFEVQFVREFPWISYDMNGNSLCYHIPVGNKPFSYGKSTVKPISGAGFHKISRFYN